MHDYDIVLVCKIDDLSEERWVSDRCCRIVRVIQKDQSGTTCDIVRYRIQIRQKAVFSGERHYVGHASCEDRPDFVDRVCRVRHERDVSRIQERKRDMCETFL